jgi:hypothetical protein
VTAVVEVTLAALTQFGPVTDATAARVSDLLAGPKPMLLRTSTASRSSCAAEPG